jgi:hypothetical protein
MLKFRYEPWSNDAIIDERNERPVIIALLAVIAAWTIPALVALA